MPQNSIPITVIKGEDNKLLLDSEKEFIEKQLNKLSEEQQEQLRNWWEPKVGQKIAGFWLNENDKMKLMYLGIIKNIIINDKDLLLDTGGSINWYKRNCLPILTIEELNKIKNKW